jgi:hypothetical protein
MATHQKRHNKNRNTGNTSQFIERDENLEQYYGIVQSKLGDCRFTVAVASAGGLTTTASLKGSLRKGRGKTLININDTVLLQSDNVNPSKTHLANSKFYIIHKYSADEARKLRKEGELDITVEDDKKINGEILFDNDAEEEVQENVEDLLDNL